MERLDTICFGRLAGIWVAYALAVLVLTQVIAAAGLPEALAWVGAAALGVCALVCTREI